MTIGERIKLKRNELKWSQRELCKRMGYSDHSTIAKIEAGKVDIPQSRIVQFSEALGVSVAYLMGWEEAKKNNDAITDIIIRLRTDNDFFEIVKRLDTLEPDKLSGLLALLK